MPPLDAGDAYFFHGRLHAEPKMPLVLGLFQRRADMDRGLRLQNQERLRMLKAAHCDAVTIFNSHDPSSMRVAAAGSIKDVD